MVLLSPLCGNMHVLTLNTCSGRSSRVSKCLSCIFCRKRVCGVACSLDYPFTVCVMLIHSPIDDWQDAYHYYLQSGLFKRIVLNREIRARFICFFWVRYLVFLFESKSLSPLTYFTGGGGFCFNDWDNIYVIDICVSCYQNHISKGVKPALAIV